jgi:two-component system, OmpR family, sensor histidine kinase KdpD
MVLVRRLPAVFALPAGFAAFLAIGTVAAALGGRMPADGVLAACAAVTVAISAAAEPLAAVPLAAIGWLTVIGFSRPPYADLRLTGSIAGPAAITLATTACAGACAGACVRYYVRRSTLVGVQERSGRSRIGGIGLRRLLAAVGLALAGLPLLTWLLTVDGAHLDLSDDLLVYLVAVVIITVLGGFWPAVGAAIAASLLLNWYFTKPFHTFTIAEPRNLLALLLFVTVAVAVSSVVHLAALRTAQSARNRQEAAALLALAQTVLGGEDSPAAILAHLTATHGGQAELVERTGGRWVRVAASQVGDALPAANRLDIRDDLALLVTGQRATVSRRPAGPDRPPVTRALLAGYAAQAAAALDRERLRIQASQAEALAEANRIRTALLAAVSHDLRTPLASVKASVSTLRQTDVVWTPEDEAALLATIEENADRLDELIGNLLDMSRLHTGSLQPFLRPTAIDEVAPLALRGLDSGLELKVPDELPLVLADPGLLERVLANLFSNASRHSPEASPPTLTARPAGARVELEIADHGPGVPDEEKERIFEPFVRLGNKPAGPGVGLGLAVAKGFAEAMGGRIEADTTPGGGLTIRLTLPMAAGTPAVEAGS